MLGNSFVSALLQPPTRQANIGCALLQPFCCLSLKSSTINEAKISCCLNQHQLVIHTQFASAWGTESDDQCPSYLSNGCQNALLLGDGDDFVVVRRETKANSHC